MANEFYISKPIVKAEEILNNDKLGGTITIPVPTYATKDGKTTITDYVTKTIPFYMLNNFSFSLRNKWEDLVNWDGGSITSLINMLYGTLTDSSQISLQSKYMSAATWKGSETPRFKINTVFVSTTRSYDPREIIKTLSRACLPITLEESGNVDAVKNTLNGAAGKVEATSQAGANKAREMGGDIVADFVEKGGKQVAKFIRGIGLVAPFNYGLNLNEEKAEVLGVHENSTLTLQIGKWFRCSQLVVEDISTIEFSKEIIAPKSKMNTNSGQYFYNGNTEVSSENEGFPLYAKCSITFRPVFLMTARDFEQCFLDMNAQESTENSGFDINRKQKEAMASPNIQYPLPTR